MLAAGCASGRPATLADRFIVRGGPAIDLGPGPSPSAPSSQTTLPPARAPRTSSDLPTLESTSVVLQSRLAALSAHPSPEAFLAVAATYRDFGVSDRGFDYLSRGLVVFPRAAALHEAAASQWRDWGLPDQGLRHAHLAVRYAPRSSSTHTTLATVLWALGAHAEALAAFARAAVLSPDAAFTRHNLCRAERLLGHPTRAGCTPTPPTRLAPGR